MTKFEGADFSIELPDEAVDASSYCFVFPTLGSMPPNLTITVQKFTESPVLEEFARARTDGMRDSLRKFEVLSETRHQRDNWDYIVSIVRWAVDAVVIIQKRLFIHVPDQVHTIYSLVATDMADNAAASDPTINNIIRSFQTNITG